MSHETIPSLPTAERQAMLEAVLVLLLRANESYLADFAKLASLAQASVYGLEQGQAVGILLAEMKACAGNARENLARNVSMLRRLIGHVPPTLQ
ncbi:hypothetical protein AWB78_08463 [Caballeronia calidae]|uniref:Uncharacterized protein n=1 Tax=Caballeronia calidae TaxID=1777139 RepID=A0A158EJZ7_9BURK|nr:hypothetical protein [Caballeronia calidae]SAL07188.1 hypothetical protein AWB78_08463 [Caballeronia calidae]